MQTKIIFVTGGVCSSLGKGIVASSTASLLKASGQKVTIMKLDPYLNVDPGTMSPFQHGEVFVLDDGSETDLDLGHYERFIDVPLTKLSTVTTGRVYSEVLAEEREGKYLGGTIQIVPHITNKIQEKIVKAATELDIDFLVIEIGGTVGDIEGEPFLEVIRQLKNKFPQQVLAQHVTLLPYLAASKELKTKPTQLSVRELRRVGIQPDIIFCRADVKIPKDLLKKVAYFCDVEERAVIPAETVKTIYQVPLKFNKHHLTNIIADKFNIKLQKPDMADWEMGVDKILKTKDELTIGLAGKYNDLDDAYLSVIESLKSAGFAEGKKVSIEWIDTEKIEAQDEDEWNKLKSVAGIIVPGGFGNRGTEGKIQVANYCRTNQKPYLGICLGSQIMAMEFARNVLGIADATSEEFDENNESKNHIVHFMKDQRSVTQKGGTMRLGTYPRVLKPNSLARELYGQEIIHERCRHRFEFNNDYRDQFEANGFMISGTSPDNELVEVVEIKDHPFMIASQYHPEFLSRPFAPHPLFAGLIKASIQG